LLAAFGVEFQDVSWEFGGLSSRKNRFQLLCQVFRWWFTKDGDMPDLAKQKTIR
jgi:hypothetical protein